MGHPYVLDPADAWDQASNENLVQVVETLFDYDESELDLPIIGRLAESYWFADPKTCHIKIKEGIKFHDGTDLDADAVKWSLDRVYYFSNGTGTLPGGTKIGDPAGLLFFPNGTGIFSSIVSDGNYNITINLSHPFGPLIHLLCYVSTAIISPTAHAAHLTTYIPLDGDIIGTGPYLYDEYVPDVETRFTRWDNYWRRPVSFDRYFNVIIEDSTSRNNAMIGYEGDFLQGLIPALVDTYKADPKITVYEFWKETGIPGTSISYLGFNNKQINVTMRKAMCHAINYTYIVKVIGNDLYVRANSLISPAYGASYNDTHFGPDFNIAKARQTLLDAGVVTAGAGIVDPATNDTTGAESTAWKGISVAAYNYSYNTANPVRSDIGTVMIPWLDEIGISVVLDGLTWPAYLGKLFGTPDDLGIFWIGWGADYLVPFNMIDPLVNPLSWANSAQINDTTLMSMISAALAAGPNEALANSWYHKIQWYMANVLYCHAYGLHGKGTYVHGADIHGFEYNKMGNYEIYSVYRSDTEHETTPDF
jgi:ABC-type transport system substrate-binding protein